ncbi:MULTISPECIES: ABC transporter permease [Gammaproteobacteria]|uniref:ABC transporter permease n=1 Tax=Gammaproteobacteria TaxID=1236 RepID=UPI000DCFF3BF|nr:MULTISPECIES: ABC transporter permease [Gammaproteobacteria]RTE86717.1 ABC transporter permease [Aliidiomarina sp. B3213]TCZ90729.1 ABC transporter permease [Lysobacter sp. N42]
MEQFIYYLKVSLKSIKRAPLPYALTILILSVGLGVFFANATFYYRLNSDPLPDKSDKLFFPMTLITPYECNNCLPPRVLSYSNVQKLSNSGIPSAQAAMYSSAGYARLTLENLPTPVSLRVTQRDFFEMFEVPILHGTVWSDGSAENQVLVTKATALSLFGRTDVVGESILLDDITFSVIGVLNDWQMLPRLYDANGRNHLSEGADIYLPLETGYDLNYLSNTNSVSYDDTDYRQLATEGRAGALHQLQFWVQLDTPADQQRYQQFMLRLAEDEKSAGRHPAPINNQLVPITEIVDYFGDASGDIEAFALVTLLFLVVCLLNAIHLALNRYLSNQYEFSLRRALGASRSQLQLQMLADVLLMTIFSLAGALLIAYAGVVLMNALLPQNSLFSSWDIALIIALVMAALICSYIVTLYPSLRASFGSLNQQLKE